MYSTYKIEFKAFDCNGNIVKKGKCKVKNKLSKFAAQCHLEDDLKKKFPLVVKMEIVSCYDDSNPLGEFGDIFGNGEMFKGSGNFMDDLMNNLKKNK